MSFQRSCCGFFLFFLSTIKHVHLNGSAAWLTFKTALRGHIVRKTLNCIISAGNKIRNNETCCVSFSTPLITRADCGKRKWLKINLCFHDIKIRHEQRVAVVSLILVGTQALHLLLLKVAFLLDM